MTKTKHKICTKSSCHLTKWNVFQISQKQYEDTVKVKLNVHLWANAILFI